MDKLILESDIITNKQDIDRLYDIAKKYNNYGQLIYIYNIGIGEIESFILLDIQYNKFNKTVTLTLKELNRDDENYKYDKIDYDYRLDYMYMYLKLYMYMPNCDMIEIFKEVITELNKVIPADKTITKLDKSLYFENIPDKIAVNKMEVVRAILRKEDISEEDSEEIDNIIKKYTTYGQHLTFKDPNILIFHNYILLDINMDKDNNTHIKLITIPYEFSHFLTYKRSHVMILNPFSMDISIVNKYLRIKEEDGNVIEIFKDIISKLKTLDIPDKGPYKLQY